MKLHISPGNEKLGNTPNLSLLPIITCRPGVPCAKRCYALKRCNSMHKNVVFNWADNTMLWYADRERFERELFEYLNENSPERFRWMVGGDIPDGRFFEMMQTAANVFPKTRFLCFTKKYNFALQAYKTAPFYLPNLRVFGSMWPDLCTVEGNMRKAWFIPKAGPDPRMPKRGVFICPGHCPTCGFKCWDTNKDVAFNEH